jgi:bifunctional non-homologous end joining protein LigD
MVDVNIGRIFLDYLRNDRMAAAVAPLSPRGDPARPSPCRSPEHKSKPISIRSASPCVLPALLKKSTAWKDYGEGHRLLEQAIKRLARSIRRAA